MEEINIEDLYKGLNSVDLSRAMHELRIAKEGLEEELKGVNAKYDYLRMKAIPEKFEEEGISNLKVVGVGRVSLTGDIHVSVPADDREGVYEYFRDIGKGSLITETINASTLKATIKTMMKSGEEVSPLIKVTPFTRASITKA